MSLFVKTNGLQKITKAKVILQLAIKTSETRQTADKIQTKKITLGESIPLQAGQKPGTSRS